jgi:uncharacterized protein YcbX
MLTIANLWIYPVKSAGGVPVDRAEVLPEGSLRFDREWLVVDRENRMQWQGDLPRMTLLRVTLGPDGLSIGRPDGGTVAVDPDHDGPSAQVTQYGNSFDGTDAGDDAAALLSDWLSQPVRLVRIGASAHRWPKVNPLHVLTDRSLEALNARLASKGEAPMELQRFRPNVFLTGATEPFEEEGLAGIDFGEAAIRLREPATRCELVNISLVDASEEREPLRTIAAMSRERATARRGSFGVYSQATGHHLRVGMTAAGILM